MRLKKVLSYYLLILLLAGVLLMQVYGAYFIRKARRLHL